MGALPYDGLIPSIDLLPKAVDGEGVELSGWICKFEMDSEGEIISVKGLQSAIDRYMDNPVVVYAHERGSIPLGKCVKAEIRPAGVWGSVIVPKVAHGKAREIYEAAKNGLLKGFSISGMFEHIGSSVIVKRLLEISLTGKPVGESALAQGTTSVVQVKAIGDSWVPADDYDAIQADAMDWLRQEKIRRMADGLQLRRDVNKLRLAALRNTVASLN